MKHTIPARQPFSFARSLTFMARFAPCATAVHLTDDAVTAAVAIAGRAEPFTLHAEGAGLRCDAASAEVARRAGEFVGADDDVGPLYAAAETDPPFLAIVKELRGLHQVRFLGLEDIVVYAVLMQRTPMAMATRYKRKFLERFGHPVEVGGVTVRAMPELGELARLEADAIADAIGHRPKSERIAVVARGVAAIGEAFLREAPYEDAKRALLAISGVGPFTAGAILLRGLGRMDDVPSVEMFEEPGRAIYGRAWNPAAIARRYGAHIGYWSYYLKVAYGVRNSIMLGADVTVERRGKPRRSSTVAR
jgi:DNA-3-methyladenine glycosylase II